jgi:hypothetical protein
MYIGGPEGPEGRGHAYLAAAFLFFCSLVGSPARRSRRNRAIMRKRYRPHSAGN